MLSQDNYIFNDTQKERKISLLHNLVFHEIFLIKDAAASASKRTQI